MKRKSCLIEEYDSADSLLEKKAKTISLQSICIIDIMHKNTIWYKLIQEAEKSCINDKKIKKIHYKFGDDKEMVEEYNMDTQVMLRRAWKLHGKLGGEGKWDVEVGDPIPDATPNIDAVEIKECNDQPIISRRNTRVNLEWRIRNLPYPIETYSISANKEENCIVVRTTNKKYFKKLQVPELQRLNIPLDQANIQASHSFNTLIISYKKPQRLIDMEKDWYQEILKVKPIKDVPNDCKAQ